MPRNPHPKRRALTDEQEKMAYAGREYIKFPHLAKLQAGSLKEEILKALTSREPIPAEKIADNILRLVAADQRQMMKLVGAKIAEILNEFNALDLYFKRVIGIRGTWELEDANLPTIPGLPTIPAGNSEANEGEKFK